MNMRRAAKVDANQVEIVKALRSVGASVQPLHSVGQGCPDLLIGWMGKNLLMEIKDGSKVASARKLTVDQLDWHAAWRGNVFVVESAEEAVRLLGA
jgi:hypothetical protein